ncbi:hypothetical protein SGL43_04189 [Streptomyces globisporus]|uniref:Uncharacterized protein n=1 Tax=Streptomyces globisporus TaxID=1908 RepID=A0ABN8V3P0_STRGL|nr:hypothetical protein SGL43_04189 [Streptomyces globisporus]
MAGDPAGLLGVQGVQDVRPQQQAHMRVVAGVGTHSQPRISWAILPFCPRGASAPGSMLREARYRARKEARRDASRGYG